MGSHSKILPVLYTIPILKPWNLWVLEKKLFGNCIIKKYFLTTYKTDRNHVNNYARLEGHPKIIAIYFITIGQNTCSLQCKIVTARAVHFFLSGACFEPLWWCIIPNIKALDLVLSNKNIFENSKPILFTRDLRNRP